ncbi:hypothetical protein BC835DRAFT_1270804 [Cytidiella melzeri]|nr:hypothetical protein BC835DRAFT_1270804 [Cytidiella melzeri]
MFFASVPITKGFSERTLQFLDDFLNAVQSNTTSSGAIPSTVLPLIPQSIYSKPQFSQFFSHVYVVSLPHREDRRAEMERVSQVLNLNWTYFDAVSSDNPSVATILEQVMANRAEMTAIPWYPEEFSWPVNLLSGVLTHHATTNPSASPPDSAILYSTVAPYLLHKDTERRFEAKTLPLTCATGNKTSGPPYNTTLPPHLILSPPKIACWYSHVRLLQHIAGQSNNTIQDESNLAEAYLILEDDVNIERDFHGRIRSVWAVLPSDWDMLFLGHCWSNESYWPPLADSPSSDFNSLMTLHSSHAPKCTHAYAVSRRGAVKLLAHLSYPPFAYSRALDQAYSWLIQTGRLKSYSVVPSIVVQRKVLASDVDPGESGLGSMWRERLTNGVF